MAPSVPKPTPRSKKHTPIPSPRAAKSALKPRKPYQHQDLPNLKNLFLSQDLKSMNSKTTNQKKIAGSFDNDYIKYKSEGSEDVSTKH